MRETGVFYSYENMLSNRIDLSEIKSLVEEINDTYMGKNNISIRNKNKFISILEEINGVINVIKTDKTLSLKHSAYIIPEFKECRDNLIKLKLDLQNYEIL